MNYWKLAIAGFATTLLVMVSGCNTTRGIGQDVEAVGDEIQEEVEERD